MRITIKLKPEHRARLLEIAAWRGGQGFSSSSGEAIEQCLRNDADRQAGIDKALELEGCLSDEEADHLERTLEEIRSSWR